MACYRIFEPYLKEILVAAILVTIFNKPYEWLAARFRGERGLASIVMCVLISLLVILPMVNFFVYAANRSVETYDYARQYLGDNSIIDTASFHLERLANIFGLSVLEDDSIKSSVLEALKKGSDVLVSGTTAFLADTLKFFFSMVIIIFTMFFFFVDGPKMLDKLMYWTPLSNKYDKEIFKKFKDVSFTTVVATFATAAAQGILGAIGFLIVGFPAFFPAIFMAFASIIPYVGTALIWLPIGAYLLFTGPVWKGIFVLAWGALVVGNSDNLLRTYLIKGKAGVHPIFVFFSILGGLSLFGFWGIFFGPLVIALAVTVLHIYELEYESVLER